MTYNPRSHHYLGIPLPRLHGVVEAPYFFRLWGIFLLTDMVALPILLGMRTVIVQIRDVPADLRHAFKVACAVEETTMREKLIELMREYVKRQEKKKGK